MAKAKRRFGDRKEGAKIRSIDPMNLVGNYIMPDRVGASISFSDSVNIEKAEKYIHKKRAEGLKGFGLLHVILAAYVRTVSQRPGLNRFVAGQKTYKRNDIIVAMTVKKSLTLNASETVMKVCFEPTDTSKDVFEKFVKEYEISVPEGDNTDFDGAARVLKRLPGVLLKFTIWILKLMDYFDWLPKFLIKLSPFHASMFITSMGSLGIPPVYHHLYSFGNMPVFVSYGAKRTEYVMNSKGEVEKKKFIDLAFVLDERICDGHYYASSIKVFREYLSNPELLDTPPETVVEDVE